jgi:hypothetical protein
MSLPENWYVHNAMLADVSAASSVRFLVPTAGILRRVETSLGGAITGADSIITVSKNGVALSPTITVANASSAEGDRDFADFYTQVAAGDWITVASGGQSSDTQQLAINVILSG